MRGRSRHQSFRTGWVISGSPAEAMETSASGGRADIIRAKADIRLLNVRPSAREAAGARLLPRRRLGPSRAEIATWPASRGRTSWARGSRSCLVRSLVISLHCETRGATAIESSSIPGPGSPGGGAMKKSPKYVSAAYLAERTSLSPRWFTGRACEGKISGAVHPIGPGCARRIDEYQFWRWWQSKERKPWYPRIGREGRDAVRPVPNATAEDAERHLKQLLGLSPRDD